MIALLQEQKQEIADSSINSNEVEHKETKSSPLESVDQQLQAN